MSSAAAEAGRAMVEDAVDEDKALSLAKQYLAQQRDEASTAAPQEAAEAAEQEPEAEEFDYEAELPPEIQQNLEGPEDEPELELEAEEPNWETDEDEEYVDDDVQKERNKRVALEKKVAWLEGNALTRNRKTWVEKDGKYFPFANVEEIATKASSRKEFDRMAKSENDRIKALPAVQRILAQKTGESKQPTADEWGAPSSGPGLVPSNADEAQIKLEAARKTGSLPKVIKAMFDTGKIKNL